ncbi:circularly permuted type 2 ATP-grasp protein [Segnochrobactrum spirostomi]|nr:circularly permuted type 2 ATP-grasp protein [Segnochrobactrum spirostomi]
MTASVQATRRGRGKAADSLVASYRPLPGVYDEMTDGNGRLRPHWEPLIAAFDGLGAAELSHRFEVANRSLRDSGVFYRVYDETGGGERPWPLSHVPLVIPAKEWEALSAGLVQRARLLESVMADAYGPASLVSSGVLPAAAIAGSPEFLRPLVGVKPAGGRHLRLYAADLGRGPDGRWWVIGDRTQAPSGAGYAIENRLALSRAMPEVFRTLKVERLAAFFQAFRSGLVELAGKEEARLCLLTPGPLNETYFEHAYLARYLGFLLVEGADLTVRDGVVYVRTISGLKRADVLLRRLDSDFADPLELNDRSRIGVPGLVQAVRQGSVAVANALGSGLIEARALMSFLPALGRAVLGEDLALPNVATWWCGQPAERAIVEEDLGEMAIAPAFGGTLAGLLQRQAVIGSDLDEKGRAALKDLIGRRGIDVVGQEIVRLSTMPVWANGKLEPRPFVLRVYVAATPDGWTVMPGGFCRISPKSDARAVNLQQGGTSADVWVIADGPVREASLLPSPERVAVRRASGTLPSRAADNLFWLGRYLERAEATLRLVRGVVSRLGDPATDASQSAALALLEVWGAAPIGAVGKPAFVALGALERRDLNGAVPALVTAARNAASVIRERLSPDAWRALTDLEVLFAPRTSGGRLSEGDAFERSNAALKSLAAFSGLAQENMNRLAGWRFLELGRRLERALATARFVRQFGLPGAPSRGLDLLLELADSQITYRSRYVVAAARVPVVDLATLDPDNPRSIAFQVDAVARHLSELPEGDALREPSPPLRIALRLQAELRTASAEEIDAAELLRIDAALMRLSNEIALRFFTHRGGPGAPRHVTSWDSLG